jgi:hypothetical protein
MEPAVAAAHAFRKLRLCKFEILVFKVETLHFLGELHFSDILIQVLEISIVLPLAGSSRFVHGQNLDRTDQPGR